MRYNRKTDPEDYYRERLMLYMPWRNEDSIIGTCDTFEQQYNLHKEIVDTNKSEYEQLTEELDSAEQRLQDAEMDDEMFDTVASTVQEQELRDRDADVSDDIADEDLFTEYDIGPDIGTTTSTAGTGQTEELIRNRISDEQYRAEVRSLNQKQKEIFYHILKTVKTSSEQFLYFSEWWSRSWENKSHKNTTPGIIASLQHTSRLKS